MNSVLRNNRPAFGLEWMKYRLGSMTSYIQYPKTLARNAPQMHLGVLLIIQI